VQDDNSCTLPLYGCTDTAATNYDPAANAYRNCTYPIEGCMNSTAPNYLPTATVAGHCTAHVRGCIWRGTHHYPATNYNPAATIDDGSCIFEVRGCEGCEQREGCADSTALNYDSLALVDDGSCAYPPAGCTDREAANYDSAALVDDASCARQGCTYSDALNYEPKATQHDGSCHWGTRGCTNSRAENYRPDAEVDDGGCLLSGCMVHGAPDFDPDATVASDCQTIGRGCTDPAASNYDSRAAVDDGSCRVSGCLDSHAANFDANATFHDAGACKPAVAGCTDPHAENFVSVADMDDGSCDLARRGCMQSGAVGYDPLAEVDDGSCVSRVAGCTLSVAANYLAAATVDDGSCAILGCRDSAAPNYDPLANADDGSCTAVPGGCTEPTAENFAPLAEHDDGSCAVLGCTDSNHPKYYPAATLDDGSCPSVIGCLDSAAANFLSAATSGGAELCTYSGCTFSDAVNYDPRATIESGECVWRRLGCTLPRALNYLPTANVDDGSCYLPGCTRSDASNFDSEATVDDGSCLVSPPPPPPPSLALPTAASLWRRVDETAPLLSGALSAYDSFGSALASLGDVEGDGGDTLAVGAENDGPWSSGAVYILRVQADVVVAAVSKIASDEGALPLPLASHDRFGCSVAMIADLDGDGVPELAVGANGDDGAGTSAGTVYVLLMGRGGVVKSAQKLTDSVKHLLEPYGRFGSALASPGDVDGDGSADLFVGAPYASYSGAVYLVRLTANGGAWDICKLEATLPPYSGLFGSSIVVSWAAAGMVRIAVGAPGANELSGAVYMLDLHGREMTVYSEAALLPPAGLPAAGRFGQALALGSDWDDDGQRELLVGAPSVTMGAEYEAGAAVVVFSSTMAGDSGAWQVLHSPQPAAGAKFGVSLARVSTVAAGAAHEWLTVGANEGADLYRAGSLHMLLTPSPEPQRRRRAAALGPRLAAAAAEPLRKREASDERIVRDHGSPSNMRTGAAALLACAAAIAMLLSRRSRRLRAEPRRTNVCV